MRSKWIKVRRTHATMFNSLCHISHRLFNKFIYRKNIQWELLFRIAVHFAALVKGVKYDLKTHLRAIKISELTIFGPPSSKKLSLNRYNSSIFTAIIFLHYWVGTKMAIEILGCTMCMVRL